MKWKLDSVEQFVRYKIQHPEQSFKSLKTYQTQKKHNEHIDKLYKQLNKYRQELNHFKTELFTLKQISSKEVSNQKNELQAIHAQVESLNQKLANAKTVQGLSFKERKKLRLKEQQQKFSRLQSTCGSEEARQRATIDQLEFTLGKAQYQKENDLLNQKIKMVQQNILQKQHLNGQLVIKRQAIQKLMAIRKILKQSTFSKSLSIERKRQSIQDLKLSIKQQQRQQVHQMTKRIKDFNSDFTRLVDSKLINDIPMERLHLIFMKTFDDQIQYGEDDNHKNQKAGQSMAKNPQKDEPIQCLKQFQTKIRRNMEQVLTFINLKRVEFNIDQFILSQQNSHSSQNQIDQKSLETSQNRSFFMEECHLYVNSHINQKQLSQFNESNLIDQNFITSIRQKIQFIKSQSDAFIAQNNSKIFQIQSTLETKEQQLDKQIQQLQTKVNKTDLQINKKSKVNL